MIIGVWGHSALGKTTWLHSIKDQLLGINENIVVVFADNSVEYHSFLGEHWIQVKKGKRWQGTKEQKLYFPLDEFMFSKNIWIVESMRWFNGIQGHLVEARNRYKVATGKEGLYMIIPWAEPETHREFIHQRCLKVGKPMSDYWLSLDNCAAEARYRLNSIDKFWTPAGIPSVQFQIEADRTGWRHVTNLLKTLVANGGQPI